MTRILVLPLLGASLLLSSCFTSPNAFYAKEDIVKDDRILGHYGDPKREEGFSVTSDVYMPDHYLVSVWEGRTGNYWIEFLGTLFKVDDKTFLDLYPTRDSSANYIPATPPGSIEILHSLVYQTLHLVVSVDITDEGVGFSLPQQTQLRELLARDSSLRKYQRGETLLFPMETPELRKLLEKYGTDEKVFPKPTKYEKPRRAANK